MLPTRFFSAFISLIISSCALAASSNPQSGGDTSVRASNSQAFSLPAANMPLTERINFSVGNSFFRNPWVIAPSTTTARDGLGPLFNTNGCQNCHLRDGRGHPPEFDGDNAVSMLVRLSVPGTDSENDRQQLLREGNIPDPTYGGQLQDFSIPGVKPEGQISISYREISKTLADGTVVQLRQPTLSIQQLNYGAMAENVQMSARIATPMIGLGLLEAIPEEQIVSLADPGDLDHDGISGRPNRVWQITTQQTTLGRFGWKAGQPSLQQQNAAAFHGDLGLTSSLFSTPPCSAPQTACLKAAHGGEPEVSDKILGHVTFYTHNLAVPMQRNSQDPQIQQGRKLFAEIGCLQCHHDHFVTGQSPHPWLSEQTISPYSDLLLHDMGEGLADQRSEFIASGREWRTPPLWGIGLTETVVGNQYFLHDGRARNLLEAILWHGGEAQPSADAVAALTTDQRQALLAFLQSL